MAGMARTEKDSVLRRATKKGRGSYSQTDLCGLREYLQARPAGLATTPIGPGLETHSQVEP